MGRFTEKQLTIMTIAVSVVISGLFAVLIYMDLGNIDVQKQEIEGLNGKIAVATIEKNKMPTREKDVIVYREIVKRDSSILPDESEINKFVNIIGEFEKFSGVTVTSVQGLGAGRGGKKKSKEAILKIPLKLKLKGSMDQFLKFINLFENYERFVSVTGFTVSAGKTADEGGNFQHEINLELETYQYDPRGGSVKRVDIKNYEARLQELPIQKAIRSSKPAHIEKYTMKPRINRRDPLVDPREAEVPEENTGESPEEKWKREKAILDQLVLDVNLLQDDIRLETKLKEDGQYMRLSQVAKAIDQRIAQLDVQISDVLSLKQITIPELKTQFTTNVVQVYERIKGDRAGGRNTPVLVERKQVFDSLQKMKEMYDAGDYRSVIQLYEGFGRVTDGRTFEPDAKPLKEEMDALVQHAQTITKFESETYRIDGVVIDAKRTSYAIINGNIVAEGDTVDTDGKIRIREIKPDSILFEFQGVVIPKLIRAK